jgi:xylulokinase
MTAYLIGIDVGTTGAKALLFDRSGDVKAEATTEYPMFTPRPQWAEQNPEDWWKATARSIRLVLEQSGVEPSDVAGVGLTGQMHGLVLLDSKGEVLRPCIMWNDQRTAEECREITERVGWDKLLQTVGNPALPGFTAPKVLWVRKHEPQVYSRAAKILLPKDYVRYRLTGAFCSEVSDASGTCLFDVGRRAWSGEMLKALEIDPAWLPEVTESPEISAKVFAEAAAETGLLEGTPVAGGGGDQAAQAVGTGIITEGEISATIGTSGVVFSSSDSYRIEPEGKLHAYCHAVPGKWHLMGVMLSAGGSFRWFRDALGEMEVARSAVAKRDPYELLAEAAAGAPAGCEGLIFLPYLTGERTPHPDPDARGAYVGITLRHGKAHMIRAVLEGVAYGLRDSLELMRALGLPLEQVRASGGGARSSFWLQMMADIFDTEIVTVNITQGAAYGAALFAGVGAGVYRDVEEACKVTIRRTGRVLPGPDAGVYADFYLRYRTLYPALAPEFRAIAETVRKHSVPD